MVSEDIAFLTLVIGTYLHAQAPIMSGNTQRSIRVSRISERKVVLVIDPKFYDVNYWKKTGKIRYTRNAFYDEKKEKIRYKYSWHKDMNMKSYAMFLNEVGAFGTHNKSMHWVNRVLYTTCMAYCDQRGYGFKSDLKLH